MLRDPHVIVVASQCVSDWHGLTAAIKLAITGTDVHVVRDGEESRLVTRPGWADFSATGYLMAHFRMPSLASKADTGYPDQTNRKPITIDPETTFEGLMKIFNRADGNNKGPVNYYIPLQVRDDTRTVGLFGIPSRALYPRRDSPGTYGYIAR
jgi:hypothetical protein